MTNEPNDGTTSTTAANAAADRAKHTEESNPGQEPVHSANWEARKPSWWEPYTPVKQPVAWLAGVGGSLVLAAAGAGAAARWGTVGVGARVAVLLCIHTIVVFLSERMRKPLPIAATSLAHLGASLVVPSTIAMTAFFGQSWRTCIAVGGLAGIAALELQAKRWNARFLRGGEVVAVGLATAGAAAITHAPVGVLLGASAIGIYALGFRKRASATAAAATLTPLLAVFATFNVGAGTIGELGARGSILAWAAPVASALASMVLGLEAKRRRSKAFLAAAIGSIVLGGSIAAWHDITIRHIGFPLLIAAALLAFEIAALVRERSSNNNALNASDTINAGDTINGSHTINPVTSAPSDSGNATPQPTPQTTSAWQEKNVTVLDFAELFSVALVAASSGSHWYAPVALLSVAFLLGALRQSRLLPLGLPLGLAMAGAAVTASHAIDKLGSYATNGSPFDIFGLEGKLSAALWSATMVLGIAAMLRKNRLLGFAAGFAVAVGTLMQLSASTLQPTAQALAALVLGTVSLGISVALDRKINGADVAGIALIGFSAVFVSWPWAPVLVALCGVACGLVGTAKGVKVLQRFGGVLIIGGGLGFLDDPRVPSDAVAGVIIAAVAVAEWFEAHRGKNRLVPFAVSALMGGLWLVSRCLEDLTVTRLSATLAVGMVAVAVGVFRKIDTVAIAGAVVCTITILLASKDRLAALPTWVWAMTGGIALLGAAASVERSMKARSDR